MNPGAWLRAARVWMELRPGELHVRVEGRARVWTLERARLGEWTEACRALLREEVPAFLDRKPWQARGEACCVIPANGVILRRWRVPRGEPGEVRRVLALQMEAELPLAPEELAWGWVSLGDAGPMQEVLVAAVRKRALSEVAALLEVCGLEPRFAVGTLVRACARRAGLRTRGCEAWLWVGGEQSDWLEMDERGPLRLRVLPWGEHAMQRAWSMGVGLDVETAAESWERRWTGASERLNEEGGGGAWGAAVQELVDAVPLPSRATRVWVVGRSAVLRGFWAGVEEGLTQRMGSDPGAVSGGGDATRIVVAEALAVGEGGASGGSAGSGFGQAEALDAMQELVERGRDAEVLWLATSEETAPAVLAQPAPRRWAVVAGLLLLGVLCLPYLEAFVFYPGLASRVASLKAKQESLRTIDRQADFLRHLRSNQTPYLETLLVLGKTVPPGSKLESLTLNRKGEMSLRISMRQPPEVPAFRSKLTESGFFASVVVEEQTPSPDRQKILVRLSGQIQPVQLRQGLKILAEETAGAGPEARLGPRGGSPGPAQPSSGPPGMGSTGKRS